MEDIQYARSGDGYVAYRVRGDGPADLLCCNEITMVSIDSIPDEPHWERFEQRLASFARLITYDRRGIGLSDGPAPGLGPSLDQWVQDAVAVLDAVGSERAALLGFSGGQVAMLLSATHPERVAQLVLFNARTHLGRVDPWIAEYDKWIVGTVNGEHGADLTDDVALLVPSLADDPQFRRWWKHAGQRGASPSSAAAQHDAIWDRDLRAVLPSIQVPTLVLYRRDAAFESATAARYMAEHIPEARLVELPGNDFFAFAGDSDAVADEIEEYVTGTRSQRLVDRVLTTVLFTDIVDSTAQAAALGDAEWRLRLDAHDAMIRRQLGRFGGREVNTTGDGFIATFDGPARAIRCGQAACSGARQLGVDIRVGVHTGEVELRGDDVGGIAVHIGARVAAKAGPGEVLVSSTVKDLVAGSGLQFEDRGTHELKGVPDTWHLFEALD